MRNYLRNAVVVGLASAGLILAGCGNSDDGDNKGPGTSGSESPSTSQSEEPEAYSSKLKGVDATFTLGGYKFSPFNQSGGKANTPECDPKFCMKFSVRSDKPLDVKDVEAVLGTQTVTVPLGFNHACSDATNPEGASKAIGMLAAPQADVVTITPSSKDPEARAEALKRGVVQISIDPSDTLSGLALLEGKPASLACGVISDDSTVKLIKNQL